ncbi:MAG: hypothetical protein EOO73_34215 [Myxococcales bacterium]|nr:MAG: hypothetical protein EOO73_34215 [Myxococcales bacterium]
MDPEPVTVRLTESTLERIAKIAAVMSERAGGITVKRGTIVRSAVERGLGLLEQELGISKKPKR